MPPRAAQKRKTDDSPYALSGLKRTTGATSHAGSPYPSREQRERDGYGVTVGRDRDRDYVNGSGYEKHGNGSAYEKETYPYTASGGANGGAANKRRKIDSGAGNNMGNSAYYTNGTPGVPNGLVRGEEGPLLTLELSTLPPAALLRYINNYNLAPTIQPSPLSAQRPHPPHTTLLNPSANPSNAALGSGTSRNYPAYGNYPSGRRENPEMVDANAIKASVVKATSTKNSATNGVTPNTTTTVYSTTSALGLSASIGVASILDNTAMCDIEEANNALVQLAQSHWNSITSAHVYNGGLIRMNEKEMIDEFVGALRSRELAIRLTT